jgi:hypothetical protein
MNVSKLISEKVHFNLGTTVYFMHANKLYRRRIAGIKLPTIMLSPDSNAKTNNPRFEYVMGAKNVTSKDFVFKDAGMPVTISCNKCFLTMEELTKDLENSLL